MIVSRLHLPLLSHPGIDRVIGSGLSRMFGKRILQGALSSDFQDPMRFFSAPSDDKAVFRRVLSYVDPSADVRERYDELHSLFRSDITLFRNLAQVVVAVHSYANPARTLPWVRELAAGLDDRSASGYCFQQPDPRHAARLVALL